MLEFLDTRPVQCPERLLEQARGLGRRPRLVVANAGAPLPMESCKAAFDAGLIAPVFTGDRGGIEDAAAALEWDIGAFPLIHAPGEQSAAQAAMTVVREGGADFVMKGQLHTDAFMLAALDRDTGIRAGRRFVHLFHITTPDSDRPLVLSDCAVNVLPDLKTRATAIDCVIEALAALQVSQPKIAVLSATEEVSAAMPSSVEADEIVADARQRHTHAHFSGPLALDLIVSKEAAKIKGRNADPVTGDADAVIVPDIVSGNLLFKALVYFRAGCAAGVVLGGQVPMILTSRADPPAARLASIALAAIIRAQEDERATQA